MNGGQLLIQNRSQKISSNVDVFLTSSIWYNNFMSKNNMCFQTLSKSGINVVGDVVDP